MRALVLGATGHVGNAVVRELLDRGYAVTAVTRRAEVPINLRGLPVKILRGDADRPGQIEKWVPGFDLVVDGAAPYPLHLYIWEDGSPVGKAEERTRRLLDAVAQHGSRLAYVGSFVTDPRCGRKPGSDLARRHPYFRVKERIESMVLSAAQAGLPVAIVNPTACYGPWDLKPRGLCLVPQLLCGEMPALAHHMLNVVDVRDVAIAVVSAVDEERFGEPILLCGHSVMLDELGARICALGGRRPPVRTPAFLVGAGVAVSRWTEALFAMGRRPSPWPSLTLSISLLYETFPMDPSPTQRALGATPRPLAGTLRDTVAWYRRIGYC